MTVSGSIAIKGFIETSFLDWPGKITAVVFLPSCNLRCPFCQNRDLVLEPQKLAAIPLSHILERIQEFKGWIDGVCITGGEPTIHSTLPTLIRAFKDLILRVKLDTNGTNPAALESLLRDGLVDCIAMDVKAPLAESAYARLTGCTVDLAAIKKSIDLIRSSPIEAIFRMTVVPSLLTEEDVYHVARAIAPAPKMVLQQFRANQTLDPSLMGVSPWPQEKLDEVQRRVNRILQGGE